MNASCESFMDYAYEGFHPITSIKERLKKICAYLYKKCDRAYHSLKNKHPKLASVFKSLSDFFKRHSNIIEHSNSKDALDEELEKIKKKSEEMDEEWEKLKKVADQNLDDVMDLQQKVRSSEWYKNLSSEEAGKQYVIDKKTGIKRELSDDEWDEFFEEYQRREFEKASKNARKNGVPENKILKNKKDIDDYFMS